MKPKTINKGDVIGNFTIIEEISQEKRNSEKRIFEVQCMCGKRKKMILDNIYKTVSCGCLKGKHFASKSKLYWVWHGMKERCYNINRSNYKNYGARGITVCDEWRNSFDNFYKWALNNGYKEEVEEGYLYNKWSIDRIDNSKGYYPENCRWATRITQNINKEAYKNTSGYLGISYSKQRNKWCGYVSVDSKTILIGCSDDVLEAAQMRDRYIDDNNLPHRKSQI